MTTLIAIAAGIAGLLVGIRYGAWVQRQLTARRFAQVLGRHEHKDQS